MENHITLSISDTLFKRNVIHTCVPMTTIMTQKQANKLFALKLDYSLIKLHGTGWILYTSYHVLYCWKEIDLGYNPVGQYFFHMSLFTIYENLMLKFTYTIRNLNIFSPHIMVAIGTKMLVTLCLNHVSRIDKIL